MYGDTGVMRSRAAELLEQGDRVRALADQLVAQTEGLDWTGRAADAMHERIHERAAQLLDSATAHESAADSLETHLREVDRLKELIAETERQAASQPGDASFRPPPPGHRDWLHVDLRGS